jgi:hypothetical protein
MPIVAVGVGLGLGVGVGELGSAGVEGIGDGTGVDGAGGLETGRTTMGVVRFDAAVGPDPTLWFVGEPWCTALPCSRTP